MFTKIVIFIVVVLFPIISSGQDVRLQEVVILRKDIAVEMQYLIAVPQEEPAAEGWPLLLFLHGLGECGSDINLVKKHGPPKLIENGKRFPFVVVSPQCPRGSHWEPWRLAVLLDEVVESNAIDEDRIYITGLSMGGFGTWDLAAYSPERFAAMWWRKYARWKTLDQSSYLGISWSRRQGCPRFFFRVDGCRNSESRWTAKGYNLPTRRS